MFKRTLAGVVVILALGAAPLSHALSLGELSLDSALNQPFEAEIPLRDAGDLDEAQVTVKLAAVQDFENAGVDYNYQLTKLNFKLRMTGDGNGVVMVSSQDPIVEPYLNFLLEARWPTGRMLREYTVLLDLPVVSDAKTSSVRAAAGGSAAQAAGQTPVSREEVVMLEETVTEEGETVTGPKPREGVERTALPEAERPTEYRVQHNDMLWDLAVRFQPEGATVQQTMLAILRNNPRAFIGDNINRLKSGYVLRLPSADEARRTTQEAAVKEIRRQNAIWRGEALPSDGDIAEGPQLDATGAVDGEATTDESPEARLSIATPGQSTTEGSGDADTVTQLRDELAANEENLDKMQRENAELNSRLEDLERQLATLQRLLELKDDQLSALQGQVGQEPERQQAEPQPEPEPAPEPAPQPEQSFFSLDNPLVRYGLIAIGLLALAIVVLRRFSQSKTEAAFEAGHEAAAEEDFADFGEEEPETGEDEDDDDMGHTTVIIEPKKKGAQPEAADEELEELDDLLAEEEPEAPAKEEPTQPVEAETDDALAEADIYMAYGRYEQAAQMLSSAIAKEPNRSDLRVKLIGVHLETRDRDSFMREFSALEELGDEAAISEVKESMTAIEGVSDWLRGDETSAPESAQESDNTLTFDLDTDDELESTQIREGDTDTGEESLSFDADFGADFETGSEERSEKGAEEEELDLSSFDFDEPEAEAETKPAAGEETFGDLGEDLDLSDLAGDSAGEQEDSLDLDLDELDKSFDLSDASESDTELTTGSPAATETAEAKDESFDLDLDSDDFDLSSFEEPSADKEPSADEQPSLGEPAPEEAIEKPADSGDLELDELDAALDISESEPDSGDALAGLESLDSGDDMSDDLGLLGDSDEVATKLDLARAYIDMGDAEGAREMLQEVLEEGNDSQKVDANELLARL